MYFCFVINPACYFGCAGTLWAVCRTVWGKAPTTGLSWSRSRRQKGAAFSFHLRKSSKLLLFFWDIWTILRQLQIVVFPLVCSQSSQLKLSANKNKGQYYRVWMLLRNKSCSRTGTILYNSVSNKRQIFVSTVLHQVLCLLVWFIFKQ